MKQAKIILLTTAAATLTAALLLLLSSFLLGKIQAMPKAFIPILNTAIWIAACMTGGFLAGRLQRENGLLWGTLTAIAPALILLTVGFLRNHSIGPAAIGRFSALFLSGAIGGVLGVNRKEKVRF